MRLSIEYSQIQVGQRRSFYTVFTGRLIALLQAGGFPWTLSTSHWELASLFFPVGSSLPWRNSKRRPMNTMYAIGAILAIGLLVYLMIALLKAEWF